MSEPKYMYSIPYSCGEDNLPACRIGVRHRSSASKNGSTKSRSSNGSASSKYAYSSVSSPSSTRTIELKRELKNWSQYCDQVVRERDFYGGKLRAVRALCNIAMANRRRSSTALPDGSMIDMDFEDRILEQIAALTSGF